MKQLYRQLMLLSLLLTVAVGTTNAQYRRAKGLRKPKPANFVNAISITGQIGGSSYYGDLRKKVTNFDLKHNIFAGIQYRVSESISVRAELGWFRLSGTDEGGDNASRNLSFRSDNYEINAVAIYDIFHQYKIFHKRHMVNPYAFLGFGAVFYNPKAELDGEWHKLRPLQTEGEEYGSATMVIPFGLGLRFKFTPHLSFGVEGRYTWTFTDYLDDVSTDYAGDASFSDPTARELADRRSEVNPGAGGKAGGIRGNPDDNDGYFIFGIKMEYVIKVPRQSYNINKNPSRFRVIKSIKKRR